MDEFRGDVCIELRDRGYDHLADEFGGMSDSYVESYHRATGGDPMTTAEWLIEERALDEKAEKED